VHAVSQGQRSRACHEERRFSCGQEPEREGSWAEATSWTKSVKSGSRGHRVLDAAWARSHDCDEAANGGLHGDRLALAGGNLQKCMGDDVSERGALVLRCIDWVACTPVSAVLSQSGQAAMTSFPGPTQLPRLARGLRELPLTLTLTFDREVVLGLT
jgi:hypothetical protein